MFELTIIVICGALLVDLLVTHLRRVRALRRRGNQRPAPLLDPPLVTVIRPIKGADVEQLENLRAALDTGYPGEVETIFVFEDDEDPGVPATKQAIAEHEAAGGHGSARILYSGTPPAGRTGKIHNMIAGEAEARGEIIVFGDSDSRPDREVLTNLVAHLVQDPTAGAAFAPAITPSAPRTAGDVGHNVILNAYLVANMESAAGPDRENAFLMGQMMAFRTEALKAIGGVRCADGQLVDDMFLGAQVVKAGYRNIVGTQPLHIINYGLGFIPFMRLWRRWLFCGRGGIPLRFAWQFMIRAVSFYVSLILTIACLAMGLPVLAALPASLFLLESLHYMRLHRLHGGAPVPLRYFWMVWMPYGSIIPIGLSMFVRPRLNWRGHTYRVDIKAKLRN